MSSYVKPHIRKSQAERREEILKVTLELLGQYGLEGTTVSRIARAVGLTPGALYRHFDSRDALIDEANRLASERASSWAERSNEPDALKRLEEFGRVHAEWAKENLTTVVRPFFLELASAQPDRAGKMKITRIKPYEALADLADQAKRQGTIRPDVPSEDIAWAMLFFAWGEDIMRLVGADESEIQGVLARNLARLFDSYRAPSDRAEHRY